MAEETAANPPSPSLPENLYATTTVTSGGGGATEVTTEVYHSTGGPMTTDQDDDDWHTVPSDPDGGAPLSSSASTEGVPDPFFDSIPVYDVSSRATHVSLDSRDSSRSARSLLSMLSATRLAQNGHRPRQTTLIPFLRRCESAPALRRF